MESNEILPEKGLEMLVDFYKKTYNINDEKEIEGVSNYILTCFLAVTQIKEKQKIKMQLIGRDTGTRRILGTLTNLENDERVEFKSRGNTYYMRKDLLEKCEPSFEIKYREKIIDPSKGILFLQSFEPYDDHTRDLLDVMRMMTTKNNDDEG